VFNHIVVGNEQAWALLAIVTANDAIGTVKDASIKVVVKQLGKRKTSGSKSKCAGDEEVDSLIKALQAASVVHKSAKMTKAGWGLVCCVFVVLLQLFADAMFCRPSQAVFELRHEVEGRFPSLAQLLEPLLEPPLLLQETAAMTDTLHIKLCARLFA